MSPIFPQITGLGLITPLGANCDETFQSLLAGQFITQPSLAKSPQQRAGNINELALAAARQAMHQAGWKGWPNDAAIIAATSKGDIDTWLTTIANLQQKHPADYPWQHRLGLGDLAATLATELNANYSIRLTYSAACASSLHALAKAVMMLRAGEISKAMVVAAESSLHPLFQGCFNNLGVSPAFGEPCRPFDQHRTGFHITQAAAAICLEHPATSDPRISPIASIDHIALAGDAHHLTTSDPNGQTLRHLLNDAMTHDVPDLIHAHATGTRANDAIELSAIESVLPDAASPPILYSHKAALGHSLGASGLISLVLNCLIHRHSTIPGNICSTHPLLTSKTILSQKPIHRPITRSLAISSGFGGATAIVALRSI